MELLSVGMTTAPRIDEEGRDRSRLTQSLASFRSAGFDQRVYLFAEPGVTAGSDGCELISTENQLGCFQNWRRGLTYLSEKAPARWYLMLQDDVVWSPGAAATVIKAVASGKYDSAGFLSAYTSPAMVAGKRASSSRWRPVKFHNNAFWGALALLLPAEAAGLLLSFPRFVSHDHHRKLDVVVGNCFRDMQRQMLVSVPSLCDHIGDWSTLGRHRVSGIQWGRRGFGFVGEGAAGTPKRNVIRKSVVRRKRGA